MYCMYCNMLFFLFYNHATLLIITFIIVVVFRTTNHRVVTNYLHNRSPLIGTVLYFQTPPMKKGEMICDKFIIFFLLVYLDRTLGFLYFHSNNKTYLCLNSFWDEIGNSNLIPGRPVSIELNIIHILCV